MENLVKNLSDSNKITRRNALKHINQELNGDRNDEEYIHQIQNLYDAVEVQLITALSDSSEVNRSMACKAIQKILNKGVKPVSMLKFIVPTLHHQIGSIPFIEECEENRLECLILIESIIKNYEKQIELYIKDISNIICMSFKDKYPEAIVKGCDCLHELAQITQKFAMHSSSFIKPLLSCIRNGKLKIRLKSINALACICIYGNISDFEDIRNTLIKCLYDAPQVRMALLSWGFTTSVKMKDRYSYWPLILPFVLFGLRDEDEEIRESAEKYWEKIGLQYESENNIENSAAQNFSIRAIELSIDRDKLSVSPFGVGCCTLIERNFHHMFEDIKCNMRDWQGNVRLQAVKLLTVCVFGLQDNTIQYSNQIINILCITFNDNEMNIVKESAICSEVLGYFISPDVYIPLIEPFLCGENNGHTFVLSCLVRNTPIHLLKRYRAKFIKLLSFNNIKDGQISSKSQNNILQVMEHLFSHCTSEEIDEDLCFTLFYFIAKNKWHKEKNDYTENILKLYIKMSLYDSEENFFHDLMPKFLSKFRSSSVWNEETDPELHVFIFLSECEGFSERSEDVIYIWKSKVKSEASPMVAFRGVQGMVDVLKKLSISENEEKENWCRFILNEHVAGMLQNSRGRTGEGLRLASISSLISIINYSEENSLAIFNALETFLEYLPKFFMEDIAETRILCCYFIEKYIVHYSKILNYSKFLHLIQMLSSRLNDKDKKVRRQAAKSMTCSFRISKDLDKHPENVTRLIDELVVFALEDDLEIQENIIEILKLLHKVCPSHALSKLQEINMEEILSL